MAAPKIPLVQCMQIDYEKWHEGTVYDLDVIESATWQEKQQIENLLVTRVNSGSEEWRELEERMPQHACRRTPHG